MSTHPNADEIGEAAREARGAFFDSLARSFPKATTGDLDPIAQDAFDQACVDVAHEWVAANMPPALTHDQLQGLARLADDLSKGAHGAPVSSVHVFLRSDRAANVLVNGETQSFLMDEFGNPIQA